jgi:hypothetical protein
VLPDKRIGGLELVRLQAAVPEIGVLPDQAQHFRALTADQNRDSSPHGFRLKWRID